MTRRLVTRLVSRWRCGLLPLLLAAPAWLSACSRTQSALNPAGPQAGRIASLWWMFFIITMVIYALVIAFTLGAVARTLARRPADESPDTRIDPPGESTRRGIVITCVVLTVAILLVFLISEFLTGRIIYSLPTKDPLTIKLTGHQWWWEAQYERIPGELASTHGIFKTANELHIPVGVPILIKLDSHDVIHSFWVPNLHGKKDLVPGQPTATWLQADRPGRYRGQCAEFCGAQHAHMVIWVVAESRQDFESWLESQRQPAPEPVTDAQRRGREVFLGTTCPMCHTVEGTDARGAVGPPLTHVAGRSTLAAGTLANNRGNLAGWILDPQQIKPGARMPQHELPPEDLHALLDYLQSLK